MTMTEDTKKQPSTFWLKAVIGALFLTLPACIVITTDSTSTPTIPNPRTEHVEPRMPQPLTLSDSFDLVPEIIIHQRMEIVFDSSKPRYDTNTQIVMVPEYYIVLHVRPR